MAYEKPYPVIDGDSAPYWEGARAHRLMIQRCRKTGQHFLYSRRLTPGIDEASVEWVQASGKGRIYAFTIARRPASAAFKADGPYVVASVELDEGARLMTNIVTDDVTSVRVGQRVEVVFDDVATDLTIPKFRVVTD